MENHHRSSSSITALPQHGKPLPAPPPALTSASAAHLPSEHDNDADEGLSRFQFIKKKMRNKLKNKKSISVFSIGMGSSSIVGGGGGGGGAGRKNSNSNNLLVDQDHDQQHQELSHHLQGTQQEPCSSTGSACGHSHTVKSTHLETPEFPHAWLQGFGKAEEYQEEDPDKAWMTLLDNSHRPPHDESPWYRGWEASSSVPAAAVKSKDDNGTAVGARPPYQDKGKAKAGGGGGGGAYADIENDADRAAASWALNVPDIPSDASEGPLGQLMIDMGLSSAPAPATTSATTPATAPVRQTSVRRRLQFDASPRKAIDSARGEAEVKAQEEAAAAAGIWQNDDDAFFVSQRNPAGQRHSAVGGNEPNRARDRARARASRSSFHPLGAWGEIDSIAASATTVAAAAAAAADNDDESVNDSIMSLDSSLRLAPLPRNTVELIHAVANRCDREFTRLRLDARMMAKAEKRAREDVVRLENELRIARREQQELLQRFRELVPFVQAQARAPAG